MTEETILIGADLDLAVAIAGEEWKTAHHYFPTMTLDPTFSSAWVLECAGERTCMLKPHNPMRQDPQVFSPSTDWRIGGPIIEREQIRLSVEDSGEWWAERRLTKQGQQAYTTSFDRAVIARGPTPLIAAMRAFVASKAIGSAP